VQLLDPSFRGGANKPSLIEGQLNYQQFGACEEQAIKHVRPPKDTEPLDPEWRQVEKRDLHWTQRNHTKEEYERIESWYYWKRECS